MKLCLLNRCASPVGWVLLLPHETKGAWGRKFKSPAQVHEPFSGGAKVFPPHHHAFLLSLHTSAEGLDRARGTPRAPRACGSSALSLSLPLVALCPTIPFTESLLPLREEGPHPLSPAQGGNGIPSDRYAQARRTEINTKAPRKQYAQDMREGTEGQGTGHTAYTVREIPAFPGCSVCTNPSWDRSQIKGRSSTSRNGAKGREWMGQLQRGGKTSQEETGGAAIPGQTNPPPRLSACPSTPQKHRRILSTGSLASWAYLTKIKVIWPASVKGF